MSADEIHADNLRSIDDPHASYITASRYREARAYRELPLARRLAEVVAADAVGGGWDVHRDGEVDDAMREQLRAVDARDGLYQAAFSARYSGGAWLWAVQSGEQQTPMPSRPRITALHPLTRHEVRPVAWEEDPASQSWGRPTMLLVTPSRDMMPPRAQVVHASRMHYLPGLRAQPDEPTGGQGYDLSVLAVYGERVEALHRALSSGSRLVDRLSMPVLRLASMAAAAGGGGVDYRARLRAFAAAIRAGRLMVTQGEDSISWSGPSMSGYDGAVEVLERQICAVEGISRTRLFGEPPRGLSGTDRTGDAMYADLLSRLRGTDYEPAVLWLCDLLDGPADRAVEWLESDHLDPLQRASRSKALAERDAILVREGILLPSEARARYADSVHERLLPELDDAAWAADDIGELDERDALDTMLLAPTET